MTFNEGMQIDTSATSTSGGAGGMRIALGGGILWVINLVSLVVLLAIGTLRGPGEPDDTE